MMQQPYEPSLPFGFGKHWRSFTNVAIRGSAIVARFLLSFFMIKSLSLQDNGVYAVVVGAVGLVPAIIGWGLNYIVSRDLVGASPKDTVVVMRDRYLVSLLSLFSLTLATMVYLYMVDLPLDYRFALGTCVVWLETLALDTSLPLVALEMATQANILQFVRNAAWVPLLIIVTIAVPAMKSIDAVLVFWIAGDVLSFIVLFWMLRNWPIYHNVRQPIDRRWIKVSLHKGALIYFSDIGLAGLTYSDRYVLNYFLGIDLVGVYSFYWSLSNALQTLVSTAIVQFALPVLVKAGRSGNRDLWLSVLRNEVSKTIAVSCLVGTSIFVAALTLINLFALTKVADHKLLLSLLLLSAGLRATSDLLNTAITSKNQDKMYAAVNIIGIFVSLASGIFFIYSFGLNGTAYAAIFSSFILLLLRVYLVRRLSRLKPEARSKP